jgi:hypothetical protein
MSLMPFTLDLRLWRWQVPGGDKLAAPARWRRHAAIARCRCRLQRSPRLSGRNPSSLSVSPPRARSSPLSVSIGICPYGPPTVFALGWQLRSGGTPALRVSPPTQDFGVHEVGAPARHRDGLDEASDHAPLLRFLMLVTAGSADGRCFVLRLPANGNSNAG